MKNQIKSKGFLLGLVAMTMCFAVASPATAETGFAMDVFPVIEIRCLSCHQPGGAGYEISGLDMRTYESLMKGTKDGPMIVPGDIGKSKLLTMIEEDAALRMPHNAKRLSKCERLVLRNWIQQGARNN